MAERVLIVDDDPVQRRLLENMVGKSGYDAVTADGGDAALAAADASRRRPRSIAWCSTSSCRISMVSACSAGCGRPGSTFR